jgi:hypothetical protein
MRAKAWWGIAEVGALGLMLFAGLLGWAQYGPSGGVPQQSQGGSRPQAGFGTLQEMDPFSEKRLRAMNADRQKSMVSDTERLLKLARQLDAEIASNSTDELTPDETRKVAEIEKLARNVKSKMSQAFAGGPEFHQPSVPSGGPSHN